MMTKIYILLLLELLPHLHDQIDLDINPVIDPNI
jgi:hypothetical protein